jgi:hypothetical protein
MVIYAFVKDSAYGGMTRQKVIDSGPNLFDARATGEQLQVVSIQISWSYLLQIITY